MRYLRVRNFEKFQHYKINNPPWIKVYSSMLDNYDFQQLPDAVKFHCVGLMLLASRLGNVLPNDVFWLGHKIGANTQINIDLLVEFHFLEFADSESKTQQKDLLPPEFEALPANSRTIAGSEFSLSECLKYVEIQISRNQPIKNKNGLASHLHKTGESDAFIMAELYPERLKVEEEKQYGPKREFTDEPCTVCFGSSMETVQDKGARKCLHCKNEKGKSTGKEPLTVSS